MCKENYVNECCSEEMPKIDCSCGMKVMSPEEEIRFLKRDLELVRRSERRQTERLEKSHVETRVLIDILAYEHDELKHTMDNVDWLHGRLEDYQDVHGEAYRKCKDIINSDKVKSKQLKTFAQEILDILNRI